MASWRILIVDDEAMIADMNRIALNNADYEVFCAYNGEQAVEMAMEDQYDLIIVNSILPGIDGIETFNMIRQATPGIIGILVADHTNMDMAIKAMNKGFSGFLQKPVDGFEVAKSVQKTLAIAASREENTRLKTMHPLYKLAEKYAETTTCDQVCELLLEAVTLQLNVLTISLMMFVEEDARLHIVASRGIDETLVKRVTVKSGEKIAGWVHAHGEPVILNRRTQEQSSLAQYLRRSEISASISFPLTGRDKILGVLNLSQTDIDVEYSKSDIEVLSVICGQAVMALENITFTHERKQNERTKALFKQYIDPEVAEILLSSGKNPMDMGGVRNITVLFADIRNFTLAVQRLSHKDIHHFLTSFFDLFSEVAYIWKGTLDKFMGDAALVAFGAPISLEDPSDAAVCTAVELSYGFEQLRQKWLQESEVFHQIGLGIGVSRGELFYGNVGSSRRLDYTVVGTDVNIAQRLASAAESGQILITEGVKNDMKRSYPIQEEGAKQLRGFEREVNLYSVFSEKVKISELFIVPS